ncbi:MAG: hypothetical protein AAB788_03625 [Patescibacteria group bacterium]
MKKGRENGKIKDMKTNFKPIKIISRAEKGAAEYKTATVKLFRIGLVIVALLTAAELIHRSGYGP